MNKHFTMGAINKASNGYEYPIIASKTNNYKCPHCDNDVTLKKGMIKRAHFAHRKSENPCNYYTHPSETQIHKDAKLLMKTLLANKTKVNVYRKCYSCKLLKPVRPIVYSEGSTAVMEHRFTHNGSNKSADVALINNDAIEYIFEICHTHATQEDARPDPWVELNATELINTVNSNDNNQLIKLHCCRTICCDGCILRLKQEEELRLKQEEELRLKQEEELRLKQQKELILKQQKELRLKQQVEWILKQQEELRLKQQVELEKSNMYKEQREAEELGLILINEVIPQTTVIPQRGCGRCGGNNKNPVLYDKEVTKKNNLIVCTHCASMIDCWLERGCKEKSFTY
tara:strand:+ start:21 stop:1052 length:1032 start_codon:yes stop_codon:yes gene_type:complete